MYRHLRYYYRYYFLVSSTVTNVIVGFAAALEEGKGNYYVLLSQILYICDYPASRAAVN
jgi:hypothetical protein